VYGTTGISVYPNTFTGGIRQAFNGGALACYGSAQFGWGDNNNPLILAHILMDSGTLSYKDASGVNMGESISSDSGWTVNHFTGQGHNAFRLNNSSASDTGSYTLANNLGPKNYTRLEMINGNTAVARAITVDGGNGGSILFNNTAATIANGMTLLGSVPVTAVATSTLASAMTGTGSLVMAGLVFGATAQAPGTWGGFGSGALYVDTNHFAAGPGPVTVPSTGPLALFTAAPTNGFAPLTVTFTNRSTAGIGAITNCYWAFGDATTTNTAAVANLTHSYTAGTYTVTLIVSDNAGLSSTNTQASLVHVASVPQPIFDTDGFSREAGTGQATFTFTGTNGVKYRVVYQDDMLSTNAWAPVTNSWATGVKGTNILYDTSGSTTQRFYRIEAKSVDAP